MEFIIMFIFTALIFILLYVKTNSNIWRYNYYQEKKNADYWRDLALKLQKEIKWAELN